MMMMDPKASTKSYIYQAPILYVAIFYVLLAAWAIVCVIFLGASFNKWGLANFFQLFMFAFVLFYTCYFSAAISYKIEVGPHLQVGFIKFRLEREKAYLFCLTHNAFLKTVLVAIKRANSDITFKRL
jgi:hypothetical protein